MKLPRRSFLGLVALGASGRLGRLPAPTVTPPAAAIITAPDPATITPLGQYFYSNLWSTRLSVSLPPYEARTPFAAQEDLLNNHANRVGTLKILSRFLELGGDADSAFHTSHEKQIVYANTDPHNTGKKWQERRKEKLAELEADFKVIREPGALTRLIDESESNTVAALNAEAEKAKEKYLTGPFRLDHLILRCFDVPAHEDFRLDREQKLQKNLPYRFMLRTEPYFDFDNPYGAAFYGTQDLRLFTALQHFIRWGVRFFDEKLTPDGVAAMDKFSDGFFGRYFGTYDRGKTGHFFSENVNGAAPVAYNTCGKDDPPEQIFTDRVKLFVSPEDYRFVFPSGAINIGRLPTSGCNSTDAFIELMFKDQKKYTMHDGHWDSIDRKLSEYLKKNPHLSPRSTPLARRAAALPNLNDVNAAVQFLNRLAQLYSDEPVKPYVSPQEASLLPAQDQRLALPSSGLAPLRPTAVNNAELTSVTSPRN